MGTLQSLAAESRPLVWSSGWSVHHITAPVSRDPVPILIDPFLFHAATWESEYDDLTSLE